MEDIRKANADEVMEYLLYLYISGAQSLAMFIGKYKRYMLDTELTKEQKIGLKRELDFTSRAIGYLTAASSSYRRMSSSLEQLQAELEGGMGPSGYDLRFSDCNELISHDLLYVAKTYQDEDAERKIAEFMMQVGSKPEGVLVELCNHFKKE